MRHNPRYAHIWINGTHRPAHVVLVERILGKRLPPGAEVHHIDGNRMNNANSNLLVCPSLLYHRLIHRRTKAHEQCGNANWERCMYCKKWDDPSKMKIYPGKGRDGRKVWHLELCGVPRNRSRARAALAQSEQKEEGE